LYVLKSEQVGVRVGVSAGLAVGNAVKRNRAKRLLRTAMNGILGQTSPGSDLLLIARSPLPVADLIQTRAALTNLLRRAGLLT
jgi:ribonuclease P protein component